MTRENLHGDSVGHASVQGVHGIRRLHRHFLRWQRRSSTDCRSQRRLSTPRSTVTAGRDPVRVGPTGDAQVRSLASRRSAVHVHGDDVECGRVADGRRLPGDDRGENQAQRSYRRHHRMEIQPVPSASARAPEPLSQAHRRSGRRNSRCEAAAPDIVLPTRQRRRLTARTESCLAPGLLTRHPEVGLPWHQEESDAPGCGLTDLRTATGAPPVAPRPSVLRRLVSVGRRRPAPSRRRLSAVRLAAGRTAGRASAGPPALSRQCHWRRARRTRASAASHGAGLGNPDAAAGSAAGAGGIPPE